MKSRRFSVCSKSSSRTIVSDRRTTASPLHLNSSVLLCCASGSWTPVSCGWAVIAVASIVFGDPVSAADRYRWCFAVINGAETYRGLPVRPRYSVAMHWGTFRLTNERLDEPPAQLAKSLARAGVSPVDFFLMQHGETRMLNELYRGAEKQASRTRLAVQ